MMTRVYVPLFLLLASASPCYPADASALVAAGDAHFVQIDYPAAIRDYDEALAESPESPELLWRLARAYVCSGEVDDDAPRRIAGMKKAEVYARKCIAIQPRQGEGHVWLAAALGYLALDAGMKQQVPLSRELLDETQRALDINPRDDAALSIRGSFFRALGNVGWLKRQLAAVFLGAVPEGGFPEAEAALQAAMAIAPDVMRHPYELGILYLDMDRKSEACRLFEQAARLPIRVAIDVPRLAKIKGYLAGLDCPGDGAR